MENLNKSFEPMDVDLSSQSTSAMDISFNNSASEIQTAERDEDCYIISSTIPSREKSPVPSLFITSEPQAPCFKTMISNKMKRTKIYCINAHHKSRQTRDERRFKIFGSLFILFGSIILYHSVNFCYKEINLSHLRETLSTQLFGQEEAIESIMKALEADDTQKILFFYGGTGVGKTWTSSLIMDNLGPSSNLYHYTMPTFTETFSSDLMAGLSMCESTTIIVDDLNIDDNVSEQINQLITKSDYLKRNLTVILILNCASTDNMFHKKCDESFQSILSETYNNPKASLYFIKFKALTDFDLRKCIDKELGDMKLDKLTYEKIVKKFDVLSDGCKGVHTKVKSFNIS